MRRRPEIGRAVVIKEGGGMLPIEPPKTMEESFGPGGKEMVEVAAEISKEARSNEGRLLIHLHGA